MLRWYKVSLIGAVIAGIISLACGGFSPIAPPPPVTVATPNDEFIGPFNSWINPKTQAVSVCGAGANALGNGSASSAVDTTALIDCINYAWGHNGTVYLPNGTYLITSSLGGPTGTAPQPFRLIGQDPANTIIRWGGSSGGTLFNAQLIRFSEINRIAFDGNNLATYLISIPASTGGTMVLYSDDVFENTLGGTGGSGYGVYSNSAANNSEQYFLRCTFSNLGTGADYFGSNAGDMWVHESTFLNDGTGFLTGWGPLDVYNTVFVGSTSADINWNSNAVGGTVVAEGNVSYNSNQFLTGGGGGKQQTCSVARNNRITEASGGVPSTINTGAVPGFLVTDNQINNNGNSGSPIAASGITASGTAAIAIGNSFTVSSSGISLSGTSPRLFETGSTYSAAGSSISIACPDHSSKGPTSTSPMLATSISVGNTCYPTPLTIQAAGTARHCFASGADQGVCSGASGQDETSASNFQADINKACPSGYTGGNRPVIHIAGGSYSISSTLSFPANCDVQFMGDGMYATNISWTGGTNSAMFEMHSPSKVVMGEFSPFGGNTSGVNAFRVDTQDNTGDRVQIWHLVSQANGQILANGIGNMDVNATGWEGDDTGNTSSLTSNKVVGNGSASMGRVALWGINTYGAFIDSTTGPPWFDVASQGNLVLDGNWGAEYGTNKSNTPAMLQLNSSSSGSITLTGFRVGYSTTTERAGLIVNGANVNLTTYDLMWQKADGSSNCCFDWDVANPTGSNVLLAGNYTGSTAASTITYGTTVSQIQNFVQGNPVTPITDNNNSQTTAWVVGQFSHLRNDWPVPDTATASGIADVQISRVFPQQINGYVFDVEKGP